MIIADAVMVLIGKVSAGLKAISELSCFKDTLAGITDSIMVIIVTETFAIRESAAIFIIIAAVLIMILGFCMMTAAIAMVSIGGEYTYGHQSHKANY